MVEFRVGQTYYYPSVFDHGKHYPGLWRIESVGTSIKAVKVGKPQLYDQWAANSEFGRVVRIRRTISDVLKLCRTT